MRQIASSRPIDGLPHRIDRSDILLGGRSEEVGVGAADVRCESLPDSGQGRAGGLENKLAATAFTADPAERFGYGFQLFPDGIRQTPETTT